MVVVTQLQPWVPEEKGQAEGGLSPSGSDSERTDVVSVTAGDPVQLGDGLGCS